MQSRIAPPSEIGSSRQMTIGRARVQRVELAVNDPIERHRARPRADHRGENQPESFPARPAAIVARRHHHRRQRERQRENRVREAHERTPLLKNENRGLKMEDGSLPAVMFGQFGRCIRHLLCFFAPSSLTPFPPTSAAPAFAACRDGRARARPLCPPRLELFSGRHKNLGSPAEWSRPPAAAIPCF